MAFSISRLNWWIHQTQYNLISGKQPPIGLLQHIESSLKKEIERQKLLAYKIENLDDIMKNVETSVSVQTKKTRWIRSRKRHQYRNSHGFSLSAGIPDVYAGLHLRSSGNAWCDRGKNKPGLLKSSYRQLKPVQLMMGKIIGIALVGLTQFLIWISSDCWYHYIPENHHSSKNGALLKYHNPCLRI